MATSRPGDSQPLSALALKVVIVAVFLQAQIFLRSYRIYVVCPSCVKECSFIDSS